MRPVPLIRAGSILPAMALLDRVGAPTDDLLRQAQLPIFDSKDPDQLVSLYHGFSFLEQAARRADIPHLGVLLGHQVEICDLGIFGQMLLQSLTLYEALTNVAERLTIINNSGARAWLTHADGLVWFNHQFMNPAKIENQQAQYCTCCLYIKIIQLATGPKWRPTEVRIQADPLPGVAEHELLSGTRLRFNQPNNAIGFPSRLLSLPLQTLGDPLGWEQQFKLQQTLVLTGPAQDLAGSLRQLICSLLGRGSVSVETAAAAAGTSPRSFQRRLADAGLNYSHEVDRIRFEMASQWLLDPTRPITEIAYDLGYSNVVNFSRAFRRWTGVPPSQFRATRLAGEDKSARLLLS